MTSLTLEQLQAAIRTAWTADTCSPDDVDRAPWTADNPAWGQCDVTALVVQDLLGGDLVLGEVHLDGVQHGYHWWNRLGASPPDADGSAVSAGIDIDLTREQFRQGQVVSGDRVVLRPPGPLPRRMDEYAVLRDRVAATLGRPVLDPYGCVVPPG